MEFDYNFNFYCSIYCNNINKNKCFCGQKSKIIKSVLTTNDFNFTETNDQEPENIIRSKIKRCLNNNLTGTESFLGSFRYTAIDNSFTSYFGNKSLNNITWSGNYDSWVVFDSNFLNHINDTKICKYVSVTKAPTLTIDTFLPPNMTFSNSLWSKDVTKSIRPFFVTDSNEVVQKEGININNQIIFIIPFILILLIFCLGFFIYRRWKRKRRSRQETKLDSVIYECIDENISLKIGKKCLDDSSGTDYEESGEPVEIDSENHDYKNIPVIHNNKRHYDEEKVENEHDYEMITSDEESNRILNIELNQEEDIISSDYDEPNMLVHRDNDYISILDSDYEDMDGIIEQNDNLSKKIDPNLDKEKKEQLNM